MLRIAGSLLLLCVALSAEVDWRFAHPGADMLVGFNLRNLASSPAGVPFREALTSMGGIGRDRLGLLEEIDEVYVSIQTRYVKGRPSGDPHGVILVRGNFDSGGVQEDMNMMGKPCLTIRFSTDRPETVMGNHGNLLVPPISDDFLARVVAGVIEDPKVLNQLKQRPPLYGSKAGEKFADAIAPHVTANKPAFHWSQHWLGLAPFERNADADF